MHRNGPVISLNSKIFVSYKTGKGKSLFHILTKTTTMKAGDYSSSAFFMAGK
jgi:hypothetical protein